MKDRYLSFFNTRAKEEDFARGTPEERSEILYKYIYVDNLESKEEYSISMRYNKDFNSQFKQLTL